MDGVLVWNSRQTGFGNYGGLVIEKLPSDDIIKYAAKLAPGPRPAMVGARGHIVPWWATETDFDARQDRSR